MFLIQEILVSDDVAYEEFACNLNACKGACCWEGDFGAPLEAQELLILEEIFESIKPFLSEKGIDTIREKGLYTFYKEPREYGTSLMNDGACVFMTRDQLGIARCGIEQAYRAGATKFPKPVSCHLYPIRVKEDPHTGFVALNYDRWNICSAACNRGKKEKIPVFAFVKQGIIRKFGDEFYDELEKMVDYLAAKRPK